MNRTELNSFDMQEIEIETLREQLKKEQDKISQLNSQLEKLKTSSGYASGSLEPDDGLHFPLRK